MPSMDAILRIDARTTGQQGLRELDGLVRRIGPGAESSVRGVSRLSQALGDVGTIAGGIGLANLAGRMMDFSTNSLEAGDRALLVSQRVENLAGQMGESARVMEFARQAADRFTLGQLTASEAVADLYGRLRPMGTSLQEIQSTYNGVAITARNAGLSLFDQKEAFRQLGQAMGSGRLQGDEFRSLMERMPAIGVAIVKVFNDIAASKGLVQITRERANQLVAEVKAGEKKQTQALEEASRERQRIAENETSAQLREIAKRYDAMRQALSDSSEDAADKESKARSERLDAEKEAIDNRYEVERKALDRSYENRADALSRDESLSDEARKALERELEDRREAELKAMRKRQEDELKAIDEAAQAEAKARQRAARDLRQQKEAELEDQQRNEEQRIRESLDRQKQDLEKSLKEQIAANKEATSKATAEILARTNVTVGDLKKMAAEGKITTDIMNKAMQELAKASLVDPTPMQKYNAAMEDLSKTVGEVLLPVVTPLINGLAATVKGFAGLPGPVKSITIGLAAFGAGAFTVTGIIAPLLVKMGLLKKAVTEVGAAAKAADLAGSLADVVKPQINKPFTPQQLGLDLSKNFKGYQLPLELDLLPPKNPPKLPPIKTDVIPDVKPGVLRGLLGQLGSIAKALGGLTLEAGRFFLLLGREALAAIPGVARLGTAFASLRIGATVAGWLGALAPFSAQAIAALTPFLTWVTGTLLPTLVGVFSGPAGWIVLGVAALVAGLVLFREPIGKFLAWAYEQISNFWRTVLTWVYDNFLSGWVELWSMTLANPLSKATAGWLDGIIKFFGKIGEFIDKNWLQQWAAYWAIFTKDPFDFIAKVERRFTDLWTSVTETFQKIPAMLQSIWNSVIDGMGRAWQWMIGGAINAINGVIKLWNNVASFINKAPGQIKLPIIAELVAGPDVKAFARGGFIQKPTLGWIGEGRNPREYVIPEGGMDAAAAGWMAGLRGHALANAWQNPAGSTSTAVMAPPAMAPAVVGDVRVTLQQTGPTLRMSDGSQWVSREEVVTLVAEASRATLRAAGRMQGGRR
jgi:tape measure domain-containing protein